MPRLFVAIDLPPDVRRGLSRLYVEMRRVRWVKPENLHLTLRFIGEIDEPQAETINAALARLDAASFVLGLGP